MTKHARSQLNIPDLEVEPPNFGFDAQQAVWEEFQKQNTESALQYRRELATLITLHVAYQLQGEPGWPPPRQVPHEITLEGNTRKDAQDISQSVRPLILLDGSVLAPA